MTDGNTSAPAPMSEAEKHAAHFMNLVLQQSNMALMLMGQVPHPETGEKMHDLEGAQFFIDQLEMLQAKTRGNLSAAEEKLLQQSVTNLRLTFVETVSAPGQPKPKTDPSPEKTAPLESEADANSGKRFTKKY